MLSMISSSGSHRDGRDVGGGAVDEESCFVCLGQDLGFPWPQFPHL